MARPLKFKCDEALAQAMQVFNRKGYEATFLDDLTDEMGINRPSLYNTFGDKHALYMKVMTIYRDVFSQSLAAIGEAPTVKQGFQSFFDEHIEGAVSGACRGCMIVNSTVESLTIGGDISDFVNETDAALKKIIADVLTKAQQAGELSPEKDTVALASYLYSAIQGFQLRAKAGDGREELEAIAHFTLSALD